MVFVVAVILNVNLAVKIIRCYVLHVISIHNTHFWMVIPVQTLVVLVSMVAKQLLNVKDVNHLVKVVVEVVVTALLVINSHQLNLCTKTNVSVHALLVTQLHPFTVIMFADYAIIIAKLVFRLQILVLAAIFH